jgi:outer membrane protein
MQRIILIALLSFLTLSSFAQNKIGFIDSDELIALMPEKKAAETVLEEFANSLTSQLGSMAAQYEEKVNEFKATYTDRITKDKMDEISMLEQKIESFQQNAQGLLQTKEQELFRPILLKVRRAIKDVAKENNFTCILDKSQGSVLYSIESQSVLSLMKKKLGL